MWQHIANGKDYDKITIHIKLKSYMRHRQCHSQRWHNNSGLWQQHRSTAQVGWLGLKVGGSLALPCIRQMNRVYSALELVVSVLRCHRNCRGYYYKYYYIEKFKCHTLFAPTLNSAAKMKRLYFAAVDRQRYVIASKARNDVGASRDWTKQNVGLDVCVDVVKQLRLQRRTSRQDRM